MQSKQLKSSELFSLLAILFLLLLIFAQNKLQKQDRTIKKNENLIEDINTEREKLEKTIEGLKGRITTIQGIVNSQDNEIGDLRRQQFPPSIVIENAGKFAFISGEAKLSNDLKNFINNELVKIIETNFDQYNINTIEVIGHTDGQPVNQSNGNLDLKLEQSARNNTSIAQLNPSSNADLGLMRALAVVKHLKQIKRQGTYLQNKNIDLDTSFRVYSAAQLILPNGKFAQPNRKPQDNRRRIEIRFTKIEPAQNFSG